MIELMVVISAEIKLKPHSLEDCEVWSQLEDYSKNLGTPPLFKFLSRIKAPRLSNPDMNREGWTPTADGVVMREEV